MYSTAFIIGNLGRDPELRYTAKGTPVAQFSVAVTNGYGDNQETVWYTVSAFGRMAELCVEYLKTGSMVHIRGTIQKPYAYLSRDNEPRATLQMVAHDIKFLSGIKRKSTKAESKLPKAIEEAEEGTEEIPF